MSSWPNNFYGSEINPSDTPNPSSSLTFSAGAQAPSGRTTLGSFFLYVAVLFVVGISVGALLGVIDPVAGAFIVLGSEVVGTIAFFLTYAIGSRISRA